MKFNMSPALDFQIHMAEDGVVVEGEGGVGAGVDMGTIKVDMVTIKVDMETIKVWIQNILDYVMRGAECIYESTFSFKCDLFYQQIMVDIQTGAKEVGEAEVGAIVVGLLI